MHQSDHLFRTLQDIETPAPGEVRDRIFCSFEKQYASLNAGPDPEETLFHTLAQLQSTPPEPIKQKILHAVERRATSHRIYLNTVRVILGIAAATIGFLYLPGLFKPSESEYLVTRHTTAPRSSVSDSPKPAIKEPVAQGPSGKKKKHISLLVSPGAYVVINGSPAKLSENDFWMVFASYTEADTETWKLLNEERDTRIRMDDFRSITLSPKMSRYIRAMYEKRKNGKPTWKARAAKRKLKNFDSREERFFKLSGVNSPLNPFDLVKFIEQ